jgi:hypothetical protein
MVINSTNFSSIHSMVRRGMDIRNSKLTLHNLVARKSDIFEPSLIWVMGKLSMIFDTQRLNIFFMPILLKRY